MHMAAFFLPVPPQQLFPSGGFFEPSHFMGRATRRPIFFELIVPALDGGIFRARRESRQPA
ncbi:hypothetical protein B5M44_23755 [Shinella sumterensis]|nr:hypothetical protein B5M44_23755 [Shinella sumterensis]